MDKDREVCYNETKTVGWRQQCSGLKQIYWTPIWKERVYEHECDECGTELEPPTVETYDEAVPPYHVGPIVNLKGFDVKCSACGETWKDESRIFGLEMERIRPKIIEIFDKESSFFESLKKMK